MRSTEYSPRCVMVTIYFKEGVRINDYFKQVKKLLHDDKGEAVQLYYWGTKERHSQKQPIHYHFAVVYDGKKTNPYHLRNILHRPKSYLLKLEGNKVKLPFISFASSKYETDNDDIVNSKADLAIHSLKRNTHLAISHISYICKVNQKAGYTIDDPKEHSTFTNKKPQKPLTLIPVTNQRALTDLLKEKGLDIPVATIQPENVIKRVQVTNPKKTAPKPQEQEGYHSL
jgi:hypothetical protein